MLGPAPGQPPRGTGIRSSRALVSMTSDAMIAVVSPGGYVREVNPAFRSVLGYGEAQVCGLRIPTLVLGDGAAALFREGILATASGQTVAGGSGCWLSSDGCGIPVRWSFAPLHESAGRISGVMVVAHDLRELEQARKELDDIAAHNDAVLEASRDAIITIDATGKMLSFSRGAERIFSYRALEVLGRKLSMLMQESSRGEHGDYLQNYLGSDRHRIFGAGRTIQGQRKDGTAFPMELTVGRVAVPGRNIFVCVIHDLSDRHSADAGLLRHTKHRPAITDAPSPEVTIDRLASEVVQPLQSVLALPQAIGRMLDSGACDEELLRELLRIIAREAQRAAQIVQHYRGLADQQACAPDRQATELVEQAPGGELHRGIVAVGASVVIEVGGTPAHTSGR